MYWPGEESLLLFWMRRSLLRSLRRLRSSSRLYQALAEHETEEASRELYLRLAANERCRVVRKLGILFKLRARLPVDSDSLAARAWRRVLISCGPKVAMRWIEWREGRDLSLTICLVRVVGRLAR
jgi:hypothetical protein